MFLVYVSAWLGRLADIRLLSAECLLLSIPSSSEGEGAERERRQVAIMNTRSEGQALLLQFSGQR